MHLPNKLKKTIYCAVAALSIGILTPSAANAADAGAGAAASSANDARFVWVDTLFLRSEPDSKSQALTKMKFGTIVRLLPDTAPLISHQEIIGTLDASKNGGTPKANITVDGHWVHISCGDVTGWAFDGYLSRYPAPFLSDKESDNWELHHADQIFGKKTGAHWGDGDSKKSADYRLLLKHGKMEKSVIDVAWVYEEFRDGGSYEHIAQGGGPGSTDTDLLGMPFTFNEALLWTRLFRGLAGTGKFVPGHHIEIGEPDEESEYATYSNVIDCTADHCDIKSATFAD